jgi:hypothetical protein
MEISRFAPVLICTLNRHVHFKHCIESLAACTHADKTDLFIGLDYPSKEAHWKSYKIIEAYLHTIKGFKTVNITIRKKNFGVNDNWNGMQKYVFEQYDRIIISEDDNVFSSNFLDYINRGLDYYENNNKIIAIGGYNVPAKFPVNYKYDYYLSTYFNGWGFGTWRDRKIEDITSYNGGYNEIITNKKLFKKFKKIHPKLIQYLKRIHDGKLDAGDYKITFHLIKNNLYTIRPIKSLVNNTGNDGSGVHSGITDRLNHETLNQKTPRFNDLVKYDVNIDKVWRSFLDNKITIYKAPKRIYLKVKKIIN